MSFICMNLSSNLPKHTTFSMSRCLIYIFGFASLLIIPSSSTCTDMYFPLQNYTAYSHYLSKRILKLLGLLACYIWSYFAIISLVASYANIRPPPLMAMHWKVLGRCLHFPWSHFLGILINKYLSPFC